MKARNKHSSLAELKAQYPPPVPRKYIIAMLEKDDPGGKRAHELAKKYREK
jgi:hypothetical protein